MAKQKETDLFGSIPISQDPDLPKAPHAPQITPSDSVPPDSGKKSTFSRKAVPAKKKKIRFFSVAKFFGITAIITLILYFLCGYYLFPYLIKTYGAQKLTKLCGREVTISRASFNPFNFRLELGNSVVGPIINNPSDKIDPVLSFSRLVLEIDPRSLAYKGLICKEFRIHQLFAHITKDAEGNTNIGALWNQFSGSKIAQDKNALNSVLLSAVADSIKSHYSLNNISIADSEIVFDDAATNKKHHITNLQIDLPTLATINYQSPQIKPQFSALINGRPISLTDSQNQKHDSSVLQFALNMDKTDIMPYTSYLPADISRHIQGGQADLKMQITYDPKSKNADEQLKVAGELNIANVILKEASETTAIDLIQLEGSAFPLSKNFAIKKLVFTNPSLNLTIASQGPLTLPFPFNLIDRALLANEKNKQLPHFEIINGTMTLTNSATPDTTQQWANIQAVAKAQDNSSKTDSTRKQTSSFSVSAEKGKQTKVNAQWVVGAEMIAEGILDANNLGVNDLPILSHWFANTIISKGTIERIRSSFTYDSKSGKKNLTLENMQVRAHDIVIADQKTPLASIGGWQSENGFFNSGKLLLQFGAVSVKKAKFHVHPPNATRQWQNILTATLYNLKDSKSAPTPLSSLEVSDSAIVFSGKSSASGEYVLNNFELSAPQITKDSSNPFTSSATSNKSPVKLSGSFSTKPFSAKGNIKAENLPADILYNIFVSDQQVSPHGTVNLDGSFRVPEPIFTGKLDLHDVSFSGPTYTFKAQQVDTTAITVKSKPLSISVDQVSLEQPHVTYTPVPKSAPLLSVFSAPQSHPSIMKSIKFESLYVQDGLISLNDTLSGPSAQTLIESINGSLTKVSNNNENTFSFKGKLDAVAPLTIYGTTSLFAPARTLDTTYQITGYPAPLKNSSLAPVIGHNVKNGKIGLSGKLQMSQNVINHSLEISISGLELGSPIDTDLIRVKGDTWKNTPLLQALLQNKEETIFLPLSTTTTKANTNYSLEEELIQQFNKVLLKAYVSPFSLLDAENETGSISPSIFFNFGSETLTPANKNILDHLAAKLNFRPLLKVTVTGHSDSQTDRKALIDEQINEIDRRQRQHEEKLSQALSNSYGKEVIDQPFSLDYAANQMVNEAKKKKIIISDKALLELAQKRIDEVINYLRDKSVDGKQFEAGRTQIIDSQNLGRDGNRTDFILGVKRK